MSERGHGASPPGPAAAGPGAAEVGVGTRGAPPSADLLGPRLLVVAGLVWLADRLLVQRRPASARHGAGMLELPGGKIERGEGPRTALARELREEWGPLADELALGPVADVLHHVYPPPEPEVVLVVLHVDGRPWAEGRWRERVQLEPGVELLDCARAALPVEQFLAADRPFVAAVRDGRVRL